MDAIQSTTKRLVENVTHPSTAAQFGCFNVPGRALDGRTIGAGEFGDDL